MHYINFKVLQYIKKNCVFKELSLAMHNVNVLASNLKLDLQIWQTNKLLTIYSFLFNYFGDIVIFAF